jgi:hypothetical protein
MQLWKCPMFKELKQVSLILILSFNIIFLSHPLAISIHLCCRCNGQVQSNPIQFFYDTNNDGIVIVLKYHLCMFGSFEVSSLMEMRLDNSARYHF